MYKQILLNLLDYKVKTQKTLAYRQTLLQVQPLYSPYLYIPTSVNYRFERVFRWAVANRFPCDAYQFG